MTARHGIGGGRGHPQALGPHAEIGPGDLGHDFEEVSKTTTQKSSSKGGPEIQDHRILLFRKFRRLASCEGVVDRMGRVWADGKEIDIAPFTTRFYHGLEDQEADSLIVAKEGADNAPAYRGLAYIVFERLPLERVSATACRSFPSR